MSEKTFYVDLWRKISDQSVVQITIDPPPPAGVDVTDVTSDFGNELYAELASQWESWCGDIYNMCSDERLGFQYQGLDYIVRLRCVPTEADENDFEDFIAGPIYAGSLEEVTA